jgi:hypothetical protein
VLQLVAGTVGVSMLPRRWTHAAAPPPLSALPGFLSFPELAILDAATARIVPSEPLAGLPGDTAIGARECGVIHYVQSLLTYFPGSDANCDHNVNAADLTATALAVNRPPASCMGGGDVDGSGAVEPSDVPVAESAIFRARPVHAGGPFSDRQGQPHFATASIPCRRCHGAASLMGVGVPDSGRSESGLNDPPNFFREFLPHSRVKRLGWKIRLLGAAAVPEVAANPLASESIETDLRRRYRVGLTALDQIARERFGAPFAGLSPEDQTAVLDAADPDFVTLLTYHTLEGMFGLPEYGGNRDRLGWRLLQFDGDSQPLGYTIYDPDAPGNYRERPDKPNSRPNPDEDCHGFSAGMKAFLTVVSNADLTKPGGPFPAPFCFDVE